MLGALLFAFVAKAEALPLCLPAGGLEREARQRISETFRTFVHRSARVMLGEGASIPLDCDPEYALGWSSQAIEKCGSSKLAQVELDARFAEELRASIAKETGLVAITASAFFARAFAVLSKMEDEAGDSKPHTLGNLSLAVLRVISEDNCPASPLSSEGEEPLMLRLLPITKIRGR